MGCEVARLGGKAVPRHRMDSNVARGRHIRALLQRRSPWSMSCTLYYGTHCLRPSWLLKSDRLQGEWIRGLWNHHGYLTSRWGDVGTAKWPKPGVVGFLGHHGLGAYPFYSIGFFLVESAFRVSVRSLFVIFVSSIDRVPVQSTLSPSTEDPHGLSRTCNTRMSSCEFRLCCVTHYFLSILGVLCRVHSYLYPPGC